jgi:site-specific DNA recombinase
MKIKQAASSLEIVLQNNMVRNYKTTVKRYKRFAVVYTRVSSQEQAESNSSLETQLKLCKDYAKREGITIKQYFGLTYESAKSDGRKEFQKMLSFTKKDKDIAFIIVYNYDRFSRTGPAAAQLCTELAKAGILVKSVTQDIDSSTPTGKFQENLFHMFNNYDNQQRSSRTITNTREVMQKGYWPYATPLGYQNLKPKHRACEHQYIITEQGQWLKKAFKWKAEGILTNKQIIERLNGSGLALNEKNFRWVISNPFYAGYVTGKLVNGKLIKGKHPALIDLQTFLKANQWLKQEPVAGIVKTHHNEALPLKIFAKADLLGSPLTGYIKKGNWYYKARGNKAKLNVNADKLNGQFAAFLGQFEYRKDYKEKLKKALQSRLKSELANILQENTLHKKRLTELENLLEGMEERFVLGELSHDLYEKYSSKYKIEITELKEKLKEYSFDGSNLDTVIEKGLSIAENLSQLWLSFKYEEKQKLQYLIFPNGILYNKEKDAVRTEKINALFAEIPHLKRILEENKKGNSTKNCLQSYSVHRTGIEPK